MSAKAVEQYWCDSNWFHAVIFFKFQKSNLEIDRDSEKQNESYTFDPASHQKQQQNFMWWF